MDAPEAGADADAPGAFSMPQFWGYPPFFTLQPVKETRQKQLELWGDLVLRYCAAHRVFCVSAAPAAAAGGDGTVGGDHGSSDFPPFSNAAIDRRLPADARAAVLDALVRRGAAVWAEPARERRAALVLWRPVAAWADEVWALAEARGLRGGVALAAELRGAELAGGTPLEGLHPGVLALALRALEAAGRARVFGPPGERGVKFAL